MHNGIFVVHGAFCMAQIQSMRTNRIVEALPFDERTTFRSLATQVDLTVNTILFEAVGKLDHVDFPEDGLVSLLVVLPNGSVAEAGFVGSEGAVGTSFDANARSSFTRATVVAAGNALRLPFDRFERMMDQSSVFRHLISQNNNRIAERAQQLAACNLLHQLESRLCRWLLQVFDGSENSSVVITQEHLAQMLGVNRARLNEALKTLQNLNAISQTQRGILTIVDADIVARRVCDCYGLMRVPKPD